MDKTKEGKKRSGKTKKRKEEKTKERMREGKNIHQKTIIIIISDTNTILKARKYKK